MATNLVFPFNAKKAIQVAAFLIKQTDLKLMQELKLLKLVYIANRRTLQEIGSPIVGREVLAMKHGPVVNGLYEMIKQRSGATLWNEHFSRSGTFGKYNVQLVKEPGDSLLSPYEKEVLEAVSQKYRGRDHWKVSEMTHDFPEWDKAWNARKRDKGKKATPIPLERILEEVGRLDDLENIAREIEQEELLDALFGAA